MAEEASGVARLPEHDGKIRGSLNVLIFLLFYVDSLTVGLWACARPRTRRRAISR